MDMMMPRVILSWPPERSAGLRASIPVSSPLDLRALPPKPATVDEGLNTLNAMARLNGELRLITVTDRLTNATLGAFLKGQPFTRINRHENRHPLVFDARRLRYVLDPDPMRFFIVMIGRDRVMRSDDALWDRDTSVPGLERL